MPDLVSIESIMRIRFKDAVLVHGIVDNSIGFDVPLLQANESARSLLNYSDTELNQLSLIELTTLNGPADAFYTGLKTNGYASTQCSINTKDGLTIPAELEMQHVVTDEGEACVSILKDLSERVRIQRELELAQEEAAKANEIKKQFLANMSHELRTPLNGIMGMTQILLGTELTPSQQEYLSLSQDAARQLTKVLTDLLALSNVEAETPDVVPTQFNMHQTLENLTKSFSPQAEEKSLSFTLSVDPAVPSKLIGDMTKVRQILINLIVNAIDYTDKGEVSITVTEIGDKSLSRDTCTLAFKVKDSGIGIAQDRLDSIFDSFTLGEDYLTKQYGGAGLGLSISRQLAQLLGGEITVKSVLNEGSTFTLVMPFTMVDMPDTQADTGVNSKRDGSTLNILLAEDEQVNSIMASRLLKKVGHTVTIVGNGQQAIEALSSSTFDLVLMDVQMPVVNGIQATEIIRSGAVENVPKDLPIIGLTAFARPSEKRRFLEAGMEAIVTKPYEADELIQAVSAYIP